MMRFLLIALMTLGLVGPLRAQSDDITGVIGGQIEALKRDDFATAFGFASPVIKRMFGTPERFGEMVQQRFPMVWRPADVQYLEQRQVGGLTYQTVLIRDGAGGFHTLEYEMIPVAGGWQINGVRFLQAPPVAA